MRAGIVSGLFICLISVFALSGCGGGGSSSSPTACCVPSDVVGRTLTVTNVSGNAAPSGSTTSYSFTATSITGSGPGGTFTGTDWTYNGTTASATVTIYYGSNYEAYTLYPSSTTEGTFTYVGYLSGTTYNDSGTYVIN